MPHERPEGSPCQHHPRHGMGQASGDVVEDVDLLPAQWGEGAPGDLGEEDDGHPFRRRPHRRPGDEPHVDGAGQHQEADEKSAEHDAGAQAVLELLRRHHRIAGAVGVQTPASM